MIPLRQQLHHNLKTFYILVVKISSSFSMLFRFFVVQTYNKYFKYARKPQKMMASYHKNPCKRVVLALFSEHLSASENHNTLIYSIFKSHADSDRCFSTFIFLLCANIITLFGTCNNSHSFVPSRSNICFCISIIAFWFFSICFRS